MKKLKNLLIPLLAVTVMGAAESCTKRVYTPVSTPEESGLNLQKITDESSNLVLGVGTASGSKGASFMGGTNKKNGVSWSSARALDVSPDGNNIAYMTRVKGKQNILVRSTNGSSATTQRTSRHVGDFSWGSDDNLYFVDIHDDQNKLSSINAHAGTFIRQLTSNNEDFDPMLSADGRKLFFTRYDSYTGPTIWYYDMATSRLTSCGAGFHPVPVGPDAEEFYCVRNNDDGVSEIWLINYVNGREMKILGDKERSFTHPSVSPDGEWLLVTGNSVSTINKEKNLDIFALKLDGSNVFLQLTYHPANDSNPHWSADGRTIYFLSDRANKDRYYNVWRMNFNDPTISKVTERSKSTNTAKEKKNSAKPSEKKTNRTVYPL